jgi:hypothetical protein
VIIHQIEQNSETGWVGKPFFKFELNTPKDSASTPGGQRFRAPDLVWHAWETDTGAVQGLIVLLQSEDAPLPASGLKPEYKRKILLRYDLLGQPHGDAVEINELVQEVVNSLTPQDIARFSPAMGEHLQQVLSLLEEGNWENVNWEGLAWYDPGRSLIVVYDTVPLEPPIAFVVPLPEGW